jgi:hypothetical protein
MRIIEVEKKYEVERDVWRSSSYGSQEAERVSNTSNKQIK